MGALRLLIGAALLWRAFRRWERGTEDETRDESGHGPSLGVVGHQGGDTEHDADLDAELATAAALEAKSTAEAALQNLHDMDLELDAAAKDRRSGSRRCSTPGAGLFCGWDGSARGLAESTRRATRRSISAMVAGPQLGPQGVDVGPAAKRKRPTKRAGATQG